MTIHSHHQVEDIIGRAKSQPDSMDLLTRQLAEDCLVLFEENRNLRREFKLPERMNESELEEKLTKAAAREATLLKTEGALREELDEVKTDFRELDLKYEAVETTMREVAEECDELKEALRVMTGNYNRLYKATPEAVANAIQNNARLVKEVEEWKKQAERYGEIAANLGNKLTNPPITEQHMRATETASQRGELLEKIAGLVKDFVPNDEGMCPDDDTPCGEYGYCGDCPNRPEDY